MQADLERELRELLAREAGADKDHAIAFAQIMAAIADYEMTRPPIRHEGKVMPGVAPSKAGLRRDMLNVARTLECARIAIETLPWESRRLFARVAGLTFQELDDTLSPLVAAARAAAERASALLDKPPNFASDLLAMDVARILKHTLGVDPTTTRDDPGAKRSGGGGSYDRVLAATFRVVGLKRNATAADRRTGIDLFNDPDGVRGDRIPDPEVEK